jgi:hypothetical protein
LIGGGLVVAGFFQDARGREEAFTIGAAIAITGYVAHRVTCWIIAGFFSPRS